MSSHVPPLMYHTSFSRHAFLSDLDVYFYSLRPVHSVHFFLIATAIPLVATNGLHWTQLKCSHYATATKSPTPM